MRLEVPDLHGAHHGGYIGCIGALSIGENCATAKKSSLTATSGVSAPPVIAQLVKKFAEHRETYRRVGGRETRFEGFVEAKDQETLDSIAARPKMNTFRG
jgi:hypothetical protein